jgi:hypothetical protein
MRVERDVSELSPTIRWRAFELDGSDSGIGVSMDHATRGAAEMRRRTPLAEEQLDSAARTAAIRARREGRTLAILTVDDLPGKPRRRPYAFARR